MISLIGGATGLTFAASETSPEMSISAENVRLILGLKLKNLRHARGLSLKDLAAGSGLSISYLSEIEKGKKYPKPDKLLALSTVLEVPFDELVSVSVDESLHPLADTLRSPFFREFPFELFGLATQDLVSLFSSDPARAGALLRTFLEIGQMYDVRVEHFLFAALRQYQLMHDNYFAEIEAVADGFRAEVGPEAVDGDAETVLRAYLEQAFGYRVDEETLEERSDLAGFRSVFADGPEPVLYVHPRLLPSQKAFVYGREIGYRLLGLRERAVTSSWLQVESFEQVLNNFRASYFAGAVLIARDDILDTLGHLFRRRFFDGDALLQAVHRLGTTPETFLYRVGQLLPHVAGFQEFFFLRVTHRPETDRVELTKVFNRSRIALPQGFWLDEHYCRRWSGLRLLQQDTGSGAYGVHAQRSHFTREGVSFFVFSLSHPLTLSSGARTSITLGFLIDDNFRQKVRFWDDPAVPDEEVNVTCERCPLPPEACSERVAEPVLLRSVESREAKEQALARLLELGRKGAAPTVRA
jgi:hypothetical protein